MLKIFFIVSLSVVGLFAKNSVVNQDVRSLQLKNLKQDFVGKVIHFGRPGSEVVRGTLVDITENDIILSTGDKQIVYNHKKVEHVYVEPGFGGLSIAGGIALIGAGAGYAISVIAIKDDPKRVVAILCSGAGSGIGFWFGMSSFYRPLKVDVSGRLIE